MERRKKAGRTALHHCFENLAASSVMISGVSCISIVGISRFIIVLVIYAMASYVSSVIAKLESSVIKTDLKLVKVRGIPQNPTFDEKKFEDVIDNFVTRDGDVFIATFVKAGTTWTQQIIHLLLRNGEPGGLYGESIPWLEATTSDFLGPREAPTWTLEKINAAPSPRYFKTHATVEHLPRGHAKIKTICVTRNPKDSAVSLYHHAKSKPEFQFTGDFNQFCEIFLAGQAENGSWFDHVLNWYKKCQVGILNCNAIIYGF